MALTNEQKVQVLQEAAIEYFSNLGTLSAWVNFINNVTKAQVKNFLKNAIDTASTRYNAGSANFATKATDYSELSDDIDAL